MTTLDLQLNLTEKGILVVKRTDNLEAYDYLLRGLEFSFNVTKEANVQARQMFEKAIALDPKYSDAYAWLGNVLLEDQVSQWNPHGLDLAVQLEQQSIDLDNSNALAYAMMSFALNQKRQHDLSIRAAERAIALDTNSAPGYTALALALSDSGRPAEALVAVHKADRLDPQDQGSNAVIEGRTYFLLGRYEEAIPPLKKHLARGNAIPVHLFLTACYVELGRNKEARAEATEVMRINPQFSLAAAKQMATMKESLRDRLFADYAKAGLK